MSDRHREALTHLSYGLDGSGGFVLLTGEVGTGKTTVSRCLMADLPENTQLAFILNPTLSSQELLATICDQLKIRYRKTGATLKTLTDKISEKLLKNHANDINTLLIIDEAQHLEAEVLEQLRLLTNLETNTKKLLQVILIGQPELQQLLKRRDLRQLAQRITARYHLLPLNQQELALYIKHRLSVADCHRALFNKGALAAIHKLSQGIPRLINLICHSALMAAYNSNNAVVDKNIVLKAASHALGDDFEQLVWWQQKNIKLAMVASALIVALLFGGWLGQEEQFEEQSKEQLRVASSELVKEQSKEQSKEQLRVAGSELVKEQSKEQLRVASNELVKKQSKEQLEEQLKEQVRVASSELVKKPAKDQLKPKKTPASVKAAMNITSTEPREELPKPKPKPTKPKNYQVAAVDGVSDDLLARFQAAIDDTKNSAANQAEFTKTSALSSDIKPLTQMPTWVQKGIPSLKFEQHIYASDGEGWVNVNGRDRYEGDIVAEGLSIDKILPQQVILTYRGEKFSLPALTNW